MRIGGRVIGIGHAPYIIAEIGVNHDGSTARARELVQAAANAGADAVKFQCFRAERLLSRTSQLAEYQRDAGAADPFSMLKMLEISPADLASLADFARSCAVDPIVTVFSIPDVAEMRDIEWAAFKIASPDIINRPLIDAMGELGKPMILSTGAATEAEIRQAVSWTIGWQVAFMQCISAYPTPSHAAHLRAMEAVRHLTGAPVGYSDHTTDVATGGLAVAAGAAILEKHITLDRSAAGPDHAASLAPVEFGNYVRFARLAAQMLGDPDKIVHDIEQDVRQVSRQSIVATKNLVAGHVLCSDDLAIKRPGLGLSPARLRDAIGRKLAKDILCDAPLTEQHLTRVESAAAKSKSRTAGIAAA